MRANIWQPLQKFRLHQRRSRLFRVLDQAIHSVFADWIWLQSLFGTGQPEFVLLKKICIRWNFRTAHFQNKRTQGGAAKSNAQPIQFFPELPFG